MMCNIWKKTELFEFNINIIDKLPRSLRSITLTGGEPFLNSDLPLIVRKIKKQCPRARIVIPTNGMLTETIFEATQTIIKIDPNIAIRISLDGIGNIHDRVRGIPDAYEMAISTLKLLKSIPVRDLGITFVATPINTHQLLMTYNLSLREHIQFNCLVAHTSEFYYMKQNDNSFLKSTTFFDDLEKVVISQLRSFKPYDLFKAYYHNSLRDFALYSKMSYPCQAGELFSYVDTKGIVYPCHLRNERMGDLKSSTIESIWASEGANVVRSRISGCKGCSLIRNVAPVIKLKPYAALLWIFKNKLRAHLNQKIFVD